MRTKHNNHWAMGVFKTWISYRNSIAEESLPKYILQVRYPSAIVDIVLGLFVFEARHTDSNYYPGNTLKNILSALFRVMKMNCGASNIDSFVEKFS